ncbi:hypothetical protein MA16_Dca003896 [Dendrobium catenatum]|uniref:Uncharacterized protein n=1 Tax=Dendrobium catenatum TaxID=906689 RepID=A0A2I0X1V1_9ASPA|nr:hypothetical protein MA16_Dca003896 [Dendrobium catenatum]
MSTKEQCRTPSEESNRDEEAKASDRSERSRIASEQWPRGQSEVEHLPSSGTAAKGLERKHIMRNEKAALGIALYMIFTGV